MMSRKKPRPPPAAVKAPSKPTSKPIVVASRRWSGTITVIGALILFFSWLLTNTIKDRYTSAKTAINDARKFDEQSQDAANIRRDLRRLEDRVKQLSKDEGMTRPESEAALAPLRPAFEQCDRIFQYISDEDHFANFQGRLVMAHPGHSKVGPRIIEICGELREKSMAVMKLRGEAFHKVFPADNEVNEATFKDAQATLKELWTLCGTKNVETQKLYSEMLTLSNGLQEELKVKMENAKWWASFAANVSVYLYVIGSIILLYGQAFDKGFPKAAET